VFKELGLTNEQANKLMPVAGEFAKKIIADRDQQFLGQILDQRKAWLETAKCGHLRSAAAIGKERCAMQRGSSTRWAP
jgi:enoyl-CoA hydratase/carnithine racemase